MEEVYNLGPQFLLPSNTLKAKKEAIFAGKKYRITILTESLVRIEYNEDGVFEDRATQLVLFRDFNKPQFAVKEDDGFLAISTKYFSLNYEKNKPMTSGGVFGGQSLNIKLKDSDYTWFLGKHEARVFNASATSLDAGTINYKKGLYSVSGIRAIDDSTSMVFDQGGMLKEREVKQGTVDTYIFLYRKDFGQCLEDYFTLTGHPPLIPRYALGNWWSKNENYTEDDIKELIEDFSDNRIPISTFVFDDGWRIRRDVDDKIVKSGYSFNKELIKEPFEIISYLRKKGIHVGLKVNPEEGIHPHEEMYSKVITYMEHQEGKKVAFAPLNPRFVDIYLKILIHPIDVLGVDFWWIDYYNPSSLETLYLLNHYHTYDLKRIKQRRPLILSRNAGIAAHRYPIHYSGKLKVSWETLKMLPSFNANAANIGLSWWSHDIGGYKGGIEDNELYTRFIQLGTFSPIFRFSSEMGKYYKREPWKWSIKTQSIATRFMNLRHKLIPYIYNEAYKYHKYGTPLIKPIYYTNPEMVDDPIYKNEYFFGSEILIAPITEHKNYVMNRTVKKFFLPEGTWYDFLTGKKYPGNAEHVSFFKDNSYPVFVKAGSIIPLSLDTKNNNINIPVSMEIQVFPGKSNEYTLYEDDGVTSGYKDGKYAITSYDYNYQKSNHTLIIRPLEGKTAILPRERNYRIRFRNTRLATEVVAYVNSEEVKVKSYSEGPDFIVEAVRIPTNGQLSLNCKGENIEIDALRLINEDIDEIISDLQITTELKYEIASILFDDKPVNKKRIAIRKLKRKGLEKKFIDIFLALLKYINEV